MQSGGARDSGGDIDVVALARDALRREEPQAVANLIENYPLELWFGMPASEFQILLNFVPKEIARFSPAVTVMLRGFRSFAESVSVDAVPPVGATDETKDVFTLVAAAQARLTGNPVLAFRMMRGLQFAMSAVPQVIDASRGRRSFTLLQTAISGMLAGRFSEALVLFEKSLVPPVPSQLRFFARDAHLRSALIHALYGSRSQSERHLRSALSVPRTQSWVEDHLDADERLVRALLATPEEAKAAFADVTEIPVRQFGEMWPFYVEGIYRVGLMADKRADARDRVEHLQAMGFASASSSGYAGSVFSLMRAIDGLRSGNLQHARKLLDDADQGFWLTKLLWALHPATGITRAVRLARWTSGDTEGLEQAEHLRHLALAIGQRAGGDSSAMSSLVSASEPGHLHMVLLAALAPELVHSSRDDDGVPTDTSGNLGLEQFTARELDVLELLARGLRRADIARELFVSVNTVKSHQRALYKKLGASSAYDAIQAAQKRGLI